MEIRLALACVVIVAGALSGSAVAASAERRYRAILKTIESLRMLRVLIVDRLEPLAVALKRTGAPVFAALADSLSEADSVAGAWTALRSKLTARGQVYDSLGREELEALDALFSQLGGSGRSLQAAALTACTDAFALMLDDARTRALTSRRLYVSIGALIGIGIAVLIV